MLYTVVILICLIVYFASMFTGGKSKQEVREQFYGNYYAEDGLINETDKPNTAQAIQNCVDNGIGIKTEVHLTKDHRAAVTTYNDLSKEFGVEKTVNDSTMEELEALGIISLQQLVDIVGGKVPLIIELKVGPDNQALCRAAADVIKASEHTNIAICSFHSGIVGWFRDKEKNIFRGIVSAPAKEFKNLSKFERFMTGNLGKNGACRPNFMLYRNRPHSVFVKFAITSGVLNGVWTIETPEEGKQKEAEGKVMIVVRGFMPETVHFEDMPVIEKTPQQIEAEKKAAEREAAKHQRSIAEILADDDEFNSEDVEELKEEAAEIIAEVKEEISEIVNDVKEELAEVKEKLTDEE